MQARDHGGGVFVCRSWEQGIGSCNGSATYPDLDLNAVSYRGKSGREITRDRFGATPAREVHGIDQALDVYCPTSPGRFDHDGFQKFIPFG